MRQMLAKEVGLQEAMLKLAGGICNAESILQVVYYGFNGKLAPRDVVAQWYATLVVSPKKYGLTEDGWIDSSYDLIHGLLKVNVQEVFRDSLDNAKMSQYWQPGRVFVAMFKRGQVTHFVVGKVLNATDYAVIYDGYANSATLRYGECVSVRFYA